MGEEEFPDAGLVCTLGLKQGRPAGQEVAEQHVVVLIEPVQGLRVVLLEGVGQAIAQAGFVVDQFAPALGQADQGTHGTL